MKTFHIVKSRLYLFLTMSVSLFMHPLAAVEIQSLANALHTNTTPFSYPLDVKVYRGKTPNAGVILCCHGYGGDNSIASIIASYRVVPDHLVGFNFPDYSIHSRNIPANQIAYGTVNELLPAVYLLKRIVIDAQAEKVSLYGFSAGGAAVVNIIAFLNASQDSNVLNSIGVTKDDVQKILVALQKGVILLDSPLKSIDEFNAAHPEASWDPNNALFTNRYLENGMNPIDSIAKWKGVDLSVVVFFQNPDEAISNRDDALFKEKLLSVNPKGRNIVLTGNEGGHLGFHRSLWKGFLQLSQRIQP
jgi:hypothetical protein